MNYLKLISKFFWPLGWVLFFLLLFLKDCGGNSNNGSKTDVIKTPVVKGSFETNTNDKINHKPVFIDNSNSQKKIKELALKAAKENEKLKNDIIEMHDRISGYQLQVDDMVNDFTEEKDSLKRVIMYKNSISLNNFTTTFEDDNLKLELNGITQGFLKEVTPTYEIKSQKIKNPFSNPRLRVFIGGGIGSNFSLNQGLYKANLSFQNKKQNVLTTSYMKINNEDYGVLEYNLYLFKIK